MTLFLILLSSLLCCIRITMTVMRQIWQLNVSHAVEIIIKAFGCVTVDLAEVGLI